jgi:23S rRNA (uridine2552-2'-O)-methyltransferase
MWSGADTQLGMMCIRRSELLLSRFSSSKTWISRHVSDMYVKNSKSSDLRSRSAYKLAEIQDKHKIIKPTDYVLDLGSAPGGWSVVAGKALDEMKGGMLVSVDLLDMKKVKNFPFIVGDINSPEVQAKLKELACGRKYNVVLSDMMANTSGDRATDHFRSMDLCFMALEICRLQLGSGGGFVCKYFRGEDEIELLGAARENFDSVKVVKPKASRSESAEIYLLATGKR